jgi:hypothetical protein
VTVFLRWLLVDLIVMRILRHRRVRPYLDRAYPTSSQYTTQFGGPVYPTTSAGWRYAGHRRRLSGCSGCLLMLGVLTLGVILLVELVHWVL